MDFPFDKIIQMSSEVIIVVAFIWLIYQQNKGKKTPFNGTAKAILDELQTQNQNHLHEITEKIDSLLESSHRDNVQIIQLLGEIKGVLSNSR